MPKKGDNNFPVYYGHLTSEERSEIFEGIEITKSLVQAGVCSEGYFSRYVYAKNKEIEACTKCLTCNRVFGNYEDMNKTL